MRGWKYGGTIGRTLFPIPSFSDSALGFTKPYPASVG